MTTLCASPVSTLVSAHGLELPLRAAHLRASAHAGYAKVTLEQVFENTYDQPLEVQYQLPLPADAAVGGFRFVLGDETVVGRIERTQAAREAYTNALAEGRTAALLEQVRDSLFSQRVGNVPPGALVRVTVELDQPLLWRAGAWEWRFPTVVAPRYVDALTTDADRLAVQVADGPLPGRLSLRVEIGDVLTGPATSPSHPIHEEQGALTLTGARLDRDVVVRWPVAGAEPGVTVSSGTFGGEQFALITLVPPLAPRAVIARDLILLLDVSGSMSGEPMAQLQRVSRQLVGGLGPQDTLEVVAFGGTVRRWRTAPEAMHEAARADAQAWIGGLVASGGTPMDDGIREALAGRRALAQRQVVLMTDGEIGFEGRVVGLIRQHLGLGSRLHVVGVGHAVNRALTAPAARVGAGLEEILTPGESGEAAIMRLRARMEAPVVVEVSVEGAVLAVVPDRCPDLYAAAPVRLLARARPGEVTVVGRSGEGAWRHTITIPADGAERPDLARLFAREAVADWEVRRACGETGADARIEELGLRYAITTRATSFVAVSSTITTRPGDARREVTVAHELAAGMQVNLLGLIAHPQAAAAPLSFGSLAPSPARAPGGRPAPRMQTEAARGGGRPPQIPSPLPTAPSKKSAAPTPVDAPPPHSWDAEEADRVDAAPPPAQAAPASGGLSRALATAQRLVRRLFGAGAITATDARWDGDTLVIRLEGVDWEEVGGATLDGVTYPVQLLALPGGATELRLILPGRPQITTLTLSDVRRADGSVEAFTVAIPTPAGA